MLTRRRVKERVVGEEEGANACGALSAECQVEKLLNTVTTPRKGPLASHCTLLIFFQGHLRCVCYTRALATRVHEWPDATVASVCGDTPTSPPLRFSRVHPMSARG